MFVTAGGSGFYKKALIAFALLPLALADNLFAGCYSAIPGSVAPTTGTQRRASSDECNVSTIIYPLQGSSSCGRPLATAPTPIPTITRVPRYAGVVTGLPFRAISWLVQPTTVVPITTIV